MLYTLGWQKPKSLSDLNIDESISALTLARKSKTCSTLISTGLNSPGCNKNEKDPRNVNPHALPTCMTFALSTFTTAANQKGMHPPVQFLQDSKSWFRSVSTLTFLELVSSCAPLSFDPTQVVHRPVDIEHFGTQIGEDLKVHPCPSSDRQLPYGR